MGDRMGVGPGGAGGTAGHANLLDRSLGLIRWASAQHCGRSIGPAERSGQLRHAAHWCRGPAHYGCEAGEGRWWHNATHCALPQDWRSNAPEEERRNEPRDRWSHGSDAKYILSI
jgi:hypothetical protein